MLGLRAIAVGPGPRAALWEKASLRIRVAHLYPDYLNIYADRATSPVFARRTRSRGHALDVTPIGLQQPVETVRSICSTSAGQTGSRLSLRRPGREGRGILRAAVEAGAALLAVCAAISCWDAATAAATKPSCRAPASSHETIAANVA